MHQTGVRLFGTGGPSAAHPGMILLALRCPKRGYISGSDDGQVSVQAMIRPVVDDQRVGSVDLIRRLLL